MDGELKNALAFYRPAPEGWFSGARRRVEAAGEWVWETIQGDFHEEQTTGQIVTGTLISMIPGVDQICDMRDLVANCRKIQKDDSNVWAWVALVLTLIGCIPTLGSLLKGAFKVLFLQLRKSIFKAAVSHRLIGKAIDASMDMLDTFLNMPATRATLKAYNILNPYHYLEKKLRGVMDSITVSQLLSVFDGMMNATKVLLDKAQFWGPKSLKKPIQELWAIIVDVRNKADEMLGKVLAPVQRLLERLANRLRVEGDNAYRAHVGKNTHVHGSERAQKEVELFEHEKIEWVDVNAKIKYQNLKKLKTDHLKFIEKGWPDISVSSKNGALKEKFDTFDQSIKAVELSPGEKLYRVVDPTSSDNNICWMRESEFKQLTSKSEWRRRFAVWKSWNENGEYVVYTVPPGEKLKVWEGRAASQRNKVDEKYTLQGGSEQIVVDPSQLQPEFTSQRMKTGWGYQDVSSDPLLPYLGLPKLETKNNWYLPEEK